jgi:hypothetical protein
VKRLTLAVGALLAAAGLGLTIFPALVSWLAQHPLTPLQLYTSAAIRIAIGALFISAARTARLPWVLRVLGAIAIMAGTATVFIGIDRARAIVDWTSHQGAAVVRLFGLLALVLGALVVYACGSLRRARATQGGA